MGILDQILDTQHQKSLEQFEHRLIATKILEPLKERERKILEKRYGLNGNAVSTLKTVGEEQGLTRERVRQIEKELLQALKRSAQKEQLFLDARNLILDTLIEHGGIMSEEQLLSFLNADTQDEENTVRFLLHLISDVNHLPGDEHIKPSWAGTTFNHDTLKAFISEVKDLFGNNGSPMDAESFIEKAKTLKIFQSNEQALTDKVLLNFLHATAVIERNVFGEFGLGHWSDIKPKDVGDKAYLVMRHHKKPEHYSAITDLINKHKLDGRTAYKETVHNKLIKDKRFVLVGRGMYALAEWGYKPGVVSDMIEEILKQKAQPMTRDEIVKTVLEKRLVKKNTILVGLSNKKLFKKVGKNLYDLNKV